jgi:hypothetical protein
MSKMQSQIKTRSQFEAIDGRTTARGNGLR